MSQPLNDQVIPLKPIPPPAKPPKRWTWWKIIPAALFGMMFVAFAIVFAINRADYYHTKEGIARDTNYLKSIGFKLSPAQFEKIAPERSTPLDHKLIADLEPLVKNLGKVKLPNGQITIDFSDPMSVRKADDFYSAINPALNKAIADATSPNMVIPIRWTYGLGALFPYFGIYKVLSQLVCARGTLAAHHHLYRNALADFNRGLALSRPIQTCPVAISQLVLIAQDKIINEDIRRSLPTNGAPVAYLISISRLVKKEAYPSIYTALQSETLLEYETADALGKGKILNDSTGHFDSSPPSDRSDLIATNFKGTILHCAALFAETLHQPTKDLVTESRTLTIDHQEIEETVNDAFRKTVDFDFLSPLTLLLYDQFMVAKQSLVADQRFTQEAISLSELPEKSRMALQALPIFPTDGYTIDPRLAIHFDRFGPNPAIWIKSSIIPSKPTLKETKPRPLIYWHFNAPQPKLKLEDFSGPLNQSLQYAHKEFQEEDSPSSSH